MNRITAYNEEDANNVGLKFVKNPSAELLKQKINFSWAQKRAA